MEVFLVIIVFCILWIIVYGIKYIFDECIFFIKCENEIFIFGVLRVIWVVNY